MDTDCLTANTNSCLPLIQHTSQTVSPIYAHQKFGGAVPGRVYTTETLATVAQETALHNRLTSAAIAKSGFVKLHAVFLLTSV